MYKKKILDTENSPIVKGYETYEELSMVLILEEQFHDAELIELHIDDTNNISLALIFEGTYFKILCCDVIKKDIHFDTAYRIIYEVSIEKCDNGYLLKVDDANIKIEAKKIVIEETVKYERINYTDEELNAIDLKAENPNVDVPCPRCGKELHYRAVGNSYEVRCYTENCIKASFRGI